MKKLFYILFFFSSAHAQFISINGEGNNVTINGAGTSVPINKNWIDSAIIVDDGWYNGFPMIADAVGYSTVGIFKQSPTHAGGGPLPLIKTDNGGRIWTQKPISVDGVEISSTNHSFIRHSSGRLVISYRVAGVIYFAYNDNLDTIFTSSATTISPGANNVVAQSPIKMLEMPSGNILFFYYQIGSAGNPTIGTIMESEDIGETFSFKSNIYNHNSAISTPTLGDWRGNEIAVAITHNTGVDATCKMIALVRTEVANEGGTYFMFFYSADGGTTWANNAETSDPGSFVNDLGATISNTSPGLSRHLFYPFLNSNSPVDIISHGDSIYVANGERNNTYGYALKWTSAIPDSAYVNRFSVWHRPVYFKRFYYADQAGSSTDCGYSVFFKANNRKYVAHYDVSRQAAIPERSAKRILVQMIKLE